MYNPQLDTFCVVAEAGSFTKAAKQLYITPSAVLQQINSLERDLGATLFFRGNSGLKLTDAGNYLYGQVVYLKDWNKSVRSALQQLDTRSIDTLRVGVPKMHKSRCFYELWTKYNSVHHDIKIDFIAADASSGPDIAATYSSVDIIEFIQMPMNWQKNFSFLPLGTTKLAFGVPSTHPYSGREVLNASDLRAQRIIVCGGPFSELVSDFINELRKYKADIHIVDAYTSVLLDKCYVDGTIILLPACSANMHPGIKLVPFERDYSMPYGFFYSSSANKGANSFIAFVKEQIENGDFVFEE